MKALKDYKVLNRLVDEIFCQSDARKLTQKELARKAGLCRSTVTRLSTFTTQYPRAQTVFELAKVVGIKISFGES